MKTVGTYLKNIRLELNMSMEDVTKHTGITDSRLNRLEHGKLKEPSPFMLKKLSELYHISLIDLYKRIGYLSNDKTTDTNFFHIEQLSEGEIKHIQSQIDFLIANHR